MSVELPTCHVLTCLLDYQLVMSYHVCRITNLSCPVYQLICPVLSCPVLFTVIKVTLLTRNEKTSKLTPTQCILYSAKAWKTREIRRPYYILFNQVYDSFQKWINNYIFELFSKFFFLIIILDYPLYIHYM